MRFTATTVTGVVPPPAVVSSNILAMPMSAQLAYDPTIQKRSFHADSGASGVLVSGDSEMLTINLNQMLISWTDVGVAGRVEIRSQNSDPVVLFQSVGGGQQLVPGLDESIWLGRYGLRVVNNSVGGEYAVTVWFTITEV